MPRLAASGSTNEPDATLRLKKLQNETQVSFCLTFFAPLGRCASMLLNTAITTDCIYYFNFERRKKAGTGHKSLSISVRLWLQIY